MLTLWKNKFPRIFETDSTLMQETTQIQNKLAKLFTDLDVRKVLDDDVVHFIIQTKTIDFESVNRFLSQEKRIDGLSRATTLFELSSFDYSLENLEHVGLLADVLANPVCQAIFDARLRRFSDYTTYSEPINTTFADDLITQLYAEPDVDKRIPLFFDALSTLRPFPPSQKYMKGLTVADEVMIKLKAHCNEIIQTIDSREDYANAQRMIKPLRRQGGDHVMFDAIKYAVATAIVSGDLYSTLSYDELMAEIRTALFKPQIDLDSFANELNAAKYQLTTGSAMRTLSLLKAPKQKEHLVTDHDTESRSNKRARIV
ncbi:hypothetical protein N9Q05_01410 [bacterium]|nr:hypothetical protein [bacterium]